MAWGQRRDERVVFERGLPAHILSIDGTWRRDCRILDISVSGARLQVGDSIEGLNLKEFFLAMSRNGSVFRRCELIRVNGEEIGVRFVEPDRKRKSKDRQPQTAAH